MDATLGIIVEAGKANPAGVVELAGPILGGTAGAVIEKSLKRDGRGGFWGFVVGASLAKVAIDYGPHVIAALSTMN